MKNKTPRSLRRLRASRANGALSRGPRTAAGKARSSQNAIRHGILAKCLVLSNESRPGFDDLLNNFQARLKPSDEIESGLVEEMVAANWRLRRTWATETGAMELAIQNEPPSDHLSRLASAHSRLCTGAQLPLLQRYETRLQMSFQRALHNLLLLREADLPNEPSPIIEHQIEAAPIAPQIEPAEVHPAASQPDESPTDLPAEKFPSTVPLSQ